VGGKLKHIVIFKNMFRLITCKSGAIKEYFLVKQDPAYRPMASNRHLDGTTAELPATTCLLAGWDVGVCRVKTLSGCLQLKTAVQMILFHKKTPLDRTLFIDPINGTLFWQSL
jgi:hypothetical protein